MKYLELYLVVLVHLATIPAVGYPLAWSRFGTWRNNRVGRALMFKAASLGALFTVAVAQWWLPWGWLSYLYAAVVTAVTVALFRQFYVLLSVLREQKRESSR